MKRLQSLMQDRSNVFIIHFLKWYRHIFVHVFKLSDYDLLRKIRVTYIF